MAAGDGGGATESTDSRVCRALERLKSGDGTAKNNLLAFAQGQLQRMARKMLHGTSFVVVRRWEQTDDVLQGTLVRLSRTIDQIPINSPKDFFKLAATNIRWELQTLRDKLNAKKADARWYQSDVQADHKGGPPAHGNIADRAEARNDGFMLVSRLLDEIETISEDDREMIDLVIIDGLTRKEAADTMGLALATFNRRYRDACTRLGEKLGDMDPPAP